MHFKKISSKVKLCRFFKWVVLYKKQVIIQNNDNKIYLLNYGQVQYKIFISSIDVMNKNIMKLVGNHKIKIIGEPISIKTILIFTLCKWIFPNLKCWSLICPSPILNQFELK